MGLDHGIDLLSGEAKRSIYHCFFAILLILFTSELAVTFLDADKYEGFRIATYAFGQLDRVMAIWLFMQLATVAVIYFAFRQWALQRQNNQRIWDGALVLLYVTYMCLLLYIPGYLIFKYNFPPASSLIVSMEQIRLLLKSHSFIRSNYTKISAFQPPEGGIHIFPEVSKFIYFMFAPTALYRDAYPRNSQIRWKYVFRQFGMVLACIFCVYFVFARVFYPEFQKFGLEPLSLKAILILALRNVVPGMTMGLVAYVGFFHFWHNAFAEMLKFGDRHFYKDWWNCTSLSEFYRDWNIIVYDWLYTYIYKDVHQLTSSPVLAKIIVFATSSLAHEYIAVAAYKFVEPSMFLMVWLFAVPLHLFANSTSRFWSVFLLAGVFFGLAIIANVIGMEWYLRQNCLPYYEPFLDILIPRLWSFNQNIIIAQ